MSSRILLILIALGITSAVLMAGCVQQPPGPSTPTPAPGSSGQVSLLYTQGVGPMPVLLQSAQIDGYIAWQPYVEIANASGIGKVAAYSPELPPAGRWTNHPTNVLVARKDFVARSPELASALAALTLLSSRYITENPDRAAAITADWLVGGAPFTFGTTSVPSGPVLQRAFSTVRFTTDPSADWQEGVDGFVTAGSELGYLSGPLGNASPAARATMLYDFGPYEAASRQVASGAIATPPRATRAVSLGYLMAVDHAALFVAVRDWQHFNDTYGIALRPRDTARARPDVCDLVVNGVQVAEVRLVEGSAGPALMQAAATDGIQVSFVGVPPAIAAIDGNNLIAILCPVDTEGSGLVVATSAPVTDWDSFAAWARDRSTAGRPLRIAAPGKGSIQDVMLRVALNSSGIAVTETG